MCFQLLTSWSNMICSHIEYSLSALQLQTSVCVCECVCQHDVLTFLLIAHPKIIYSPSCHSKPNKKRYTKLPPNFIVWTQNTIETFLKLSFFVLLFWFSKGSVKHLLIQIRIYNLYLQRINKVSHFCQKFSRLVFRFLWRSSEDWRKVLCGL